MFTPEYGYSLFLQLPAYYIIPAIVLLFLIFAYHQARFWMWTIFAALILWGYAAPQWLWFAFGVIAVVFNIFPIRRYLVSFPLMKILKGIGFLPTISETERIALEAGKNWFEGNYFRGRPDFKKILKEPWPELTEKEEKFLEGPAEEVCEMTNDWQVHIDQDLPPEVWDYLKKHRFFGMIIPEKFGGLGFSAYAMNRAVQKLGSRSIPLAVDVMVPNSLGPAELLVHYGTEKQQNYYLPRLAKGQEIPAFALTEPNAGSDASSIESHGKVFKGTDGKLYLKLNWNKRYITLASVATLLGLAFRLEDPDNLLGKGTNPGITCALIPTNTTGVTNNQRHDPLGVPFINAPTTGKDVVVSVDQIIGGPEQAGNGWKMLMETLAGGRGIYLPALSLAGSKFASRMTGSYAQVREQFGLPIGKFEGVEELLARICGITYMMDAFNKFTCGAIDQGHSPAVVSAAVKYMGSELNRQSIIHAMDIAGGKGIILGPNNLIAPGYIAAPIGITVEGSNVLTRSLIVFGQGLISCHPYAYKLMDSISKNDVKKFDSALWKHTSMIFSNAFRSILLSLTRGRIAGSPVRGKTSHYYRKLQWATTTFSLTADLALITMGASLKKKEKLSGRFADVFSWLYICTCVLRKFEAEGRRKEDLPLVHWSLKYGLHQMQINMEAIFKNFKAPLIGPLIRGPVSFWSRMNAYSAFPEDELTARVARIIQKPGGQRDRLTRGLYIPTADNEPMAVLEKAFALNWEARPVINKLKNAVRSRKLPDLNLRELAHKAKQEGIISDKEAFLINETENARDEVVKVDAFPAENFRNHVSGKADIRKMEKEKKAYETVSSSDKKKSSESLLDKLKKIARL